MSRQTPFARAFEPWVAEWSAMGLSGTQERVLLLLVARMEPDGKGGFTSWRPRAEMAELLGLSETAIKKAIAGLVQKGALKRLGRSCKSHSQKYRVMPVFKGGTDRYPIKPKGVPERVPKGYLGGTPLRTKERGSASSRQPTPSEKEPTEAPPACGLWGPPTV